MITQIEYEDLNPSRIEDWSAPLGTLLNEATKCLQSGEEGCRDRCIDALKKFVEWSPFGSLDNVALDAVHDIVARSVNEALAEIAKRTANLQRLSKDLRLVAEGAQQDASAIRLEAVTKVIEATTKSIEALSNLDKAIKDDAGAAELTKRVRDLVKKIQALRDELESGQHP